MAQADSYGVFMRVIKENQMEKNGNEMETLGSSKGVYRDITTIIGEPRGPSTGPNPGRYTIP